MRPRSARDRVRIFVSFLHVFIHVSAVGHECFLFLDLICHSSCNRFIRSQAVLRLEKGVELVRS